MEKSIYIIAFGFLWYFINGSGKMNELKRSSCNVLYLSYDGLTDSLGQSQILPYLIGLASQGFSITILSFEKEHRFLSEKENVSRQCHDQGITWIPLRYHKNPPVLSTVYDVMTLQRM